MTGSSAPPDGSCQTAPSGMPEIITRSTGTILWGPHTEPADLILHIVSVHSRHNITPETFSVFGFDTHPSAPSAT